MPNKRSSCLDHQAGVWVNKVGALRATQECSRNKVIWCEANAAVVFWGQLNMTARTTEASVEGVPYLSGWGQLILVALNSAANKLGIHLFNRHDRSLVWA